MLMPDPFAKKNGRYTITNLYLDSLGLGSYREVEAGLEHRQKVRYRRYDNGTGTFLEIKRKDGPIVTKDRCLMSDGGSPVFRRVRLLTAQNRLFPTLWVRYQREPWILPGNGLRITFDSRIEVSRATARSAEFPHSWSQRLFPGLTILEVKFTGTFPGWLHRMIAAGSLERRMTGKYFFAAQRLFMV